MADYDSAASSSSSGTASQYDPAEVARREAGWEDVEPDVEEMPPVVSLFGDGATFADPLAMLDHVRDRFGFDFLGVRDRLGLDFYDTIKLVNYIRSEVAKGNMNPDVSSKALFEDVKYMQPVLEDDALLFSLDDLPQPTSTVDRSQVDGVPSSSEDLGVKVAQLEQEKEELIARLQELQRLEALRLEDDLKNLEASGEKAQGKPMADRLKEDDDAYFKGYSDRNIHATMLGDKVRTEGYRDFIYDNKHLFAGKTVLDVGCGTGILSMFCARAGAAKVIAVDNSDIIQKAREIAYANGMTEKITFIRGKIEEVVLPVDKVDIIVSEWMGYGLLYESMFDSVLWARDRYLVPGGLMVPSHMSLRIAPVNDERRYQERESFWADVYGFDMLAMMKEEDKEGKTAIEVDPHGSEVVCGESTLFRHLSLHSAAKKDLSFTEPFSLQVDKDIDHLDGFLIWFDNFFATSSSATIDDGITAEEYAKAGGHAFTTGPYGTQTHWFQCFLKNTPRAKTLPLEKGSKIKGTIAYTTLEDNPRSLSVKLNWEVEGKSEKGSRLYYMS